MTVDLTTVKLASIPFPMYSSADASAAHQHIRNRPHLGVAYDAVCMITFTATTTVITITHRVTHENHNVAVDIAYFSIIFLSSVKKRRCSLLKLTLYKTYI